MQNAIHAAPLELGRASGVGVTINMALLRSWELGELVHGFGIEQEETEITDDRVLWCG